MQVFSKGSPELATTKPAQDFTNDSGYSSFEPEVISVSPNGTVVSSLACLALCVSAYMMA